MIVITIHGVNELLKSLECGECHSKCIVRIRTKSLDFDYENFIENFSDQQIRKFAYFSVGTNNFVRVPNSRTDSSYREYHLIFRTVFKKSK